MTPAVNVIPDNTCNDARDTALQAATTERDACLQNCTPNTTVINVQCTGDCEQTCFSAYNAAESDIESEFLICSGQVNEVCTQYLSGNLRHIDMDETALVCRSKWKLRYKKKDQIEEEPETK